MYVQDSLSGHDSAMQHMQAALMRVELILQQSSSLSAQSEPVQGHKAAAAATLLTNQQPVCLRFAFFPNIPVALSRACLPSMQSAGPVR